jgi:hypothetical protein
MYSGELTRTPPQKALPRHLGLIVGVNQYQDRTFCPLQFAENDARALAQWLVNNKGGKWSPPDVQLVQGQHATRELIESLVSQICVQKAEEGDSILLYFAGHTFIDERSGEGYLAFTNSQYQDPTTCLSLLSLTQHILTRSRASQILCIFDCFQSGQMWSMRRTSPYDSKPLLGSSVLNILQTQANRLFMCSCRGNDRVAESGERGMGPLIHGMILGLCGPAIDQPTGTVTLAKLHAHLFSTLDEQHRPQLFGQQQTPFLLVGALPDNTPEIPSPVANPPAAGAPWMAAAGSGPPTSGLLKKGLLSGAMGAAVAASIPAAASADATQAATLEQQNQALIAQAQQLFDAHKYGEAFNLIEQVLQGSPNDLAALILKGQLLGTSARYPEAQSTIEHILQLDPNNAMGWSMRAVVLSNLGQFQMALEAIERSLELDSQNPETYAIKNNIMGSLAISQSQAQNIPASKSRTSTKAPTSFIRAFLTGFGLSILGIVLGLLGVALVVFVSSIPYIGLLISSIGLATLCVSAARGSFRNGIAILLEVTIFTVIIAGLLGGVYRFEKETLFNQLSMRPSLFQPLLFLVVWLAAAAGVPFILALLGWLIGLPFRLLRRKKAIEMS